MHIRAMLVFLTFRNICQSHFTFLSDVCLLFFSFHLQIGMVSSILAYKFGSTFAWITSVSVATYIAFTLAVTQV